MISTAQDSSSQRVDATKAPAIQHFKHPRSCVFSKEFLLTVAGQSIEVLHTEAAAFANFVFDPSDGPVEVVVKRLHDTIEEFAIRPVKLGIEGKAEVKELRFTLENTDKVSVEIEGMRPLFLWANPPETVKPSPEDPKVRYFKRGQIYEIGELEINSGETLYIEGGAVLKARVICNNAQDVTIRGYGILDGGFYDRERGDYVASIVFNRCRRVTLHDITMIHPSGWMVVPGASEHVEIYNLKQIGEVVCSDGIDIVGSKHVHIHDCFLRNNDDCVVVKALLLGKKNLTAAQFDFRECPEDILIENCTLLCAEAGNAMEIGHELSVEYVRDVTFRNIDVLSVHTNGAVFSLHNNDRANIENITFEDIRIEHCWDKFIDFRISKSRFSSDEERGHIRGVTLRGIHWHMMPCNQGYTVSIIGGWSQDNLIEDVNIINMRINDHVVQDIDELEITTRYTRNIRLSEAEDLAALPHSVATV
ncbi:glycosyl hydrolase family 28 protein [Cerasicoccus fimbriatus]|uniref:glycosyl hydrolase family 28 protein n=1 Tax=Cerasicoccus fimbriatus TaxID=3014554 RepID=UPI0022B5864D|nr:glycosyl hydrolase family 28 protein [Cerasicoccus sp. TK19100]